MNEVLKTGATVATPLGAIGFIAGLAFFAYYRYLKSQERRLQAIPESERASSVDSWYARLGLTIQNLTRQQKYEFVCREMDKRTNFAKLLVITLAVVFVICFGIAALSFWRGSRSAEADELRDEIKATTAKLTALVGDLSGKLNQTQVQHSDKMLLEQADIALRKAKRGYTLHVSNGPTTFIFDLTFVDKDGEPHYFRSVQPTDRISAIQQALREIGEKWPSYDVNLPE
jgi:hypothetical protein